MANPSEMLENNEPQGDLSGVRQLGRPVAWGKTALVLTVCGWFTDRQTLLKDIENAITEMIGERRTGSFVVQFELNGPTPDSPATEEERLELYKQLLVEAETNPVLAAVFAQIEALKPAEPLHPPSF